MLFFSPVQYQCEFNWRERILNVHMQFDNQKEPCNSQENLYIQNMIEICAYYRVLIRTERVRKVYNGFHEGER